MLQVFGRTRSVFAALLLSAAFAPAFVPGEARGQGLPPERPAPAERIEALEESLAGSGDVEVAGTVLAGERLRRFYAGRAFRPAWGPHHGFPQNADLLVHTLENADAHGLRPERYHLPTIERLRSRETAPAALDLLLTDAFLTYASDLRQGQLADSQLPAIWAIEGTDFDAVAALEEALAARELGRTLADLPPSHPEYEALVAMLADYRALSGKGGWPQVADGPLLREGDAAARVVALRERLMMTGDLPAVVAMSESYDQPVADAVRFFQGRHGIAVDGIVGPNTLRELNRTAAEKVRGIVVNLDRWRQFPRRFPVRHVRVNVADARLRLVEGDKTVLASRVVVGTPFNRTPVMRMDMEAVVLNPDWTLPYSIASTEILPQLKKNPDYLRENNMHIVGREQDPHGLSVNWGEISARNFPFRLRRRPGPENPMGRIKFASPNRYAIFLHDTPARSLFEDRARRFSHGCVRVEKAHELMEIVLGDQAKWDAGTLRAAIAEGRTRWLPLNDKIPMFLLYVTAFSAGGQAHFRHDAYGRDEEYRRALDAGSDERFVG